MISSCDFFNSQTCFSIEAPKLWTNIIIIIIIVCTDIFRLPLISVGGPSPVVDGMTDTDCCIL